ncbi:IMPACT family protein [Flavobacterium gawalongense]|uniref:YigZ family protein n=1 Tax=Flavobacterium gawalongense TaxID=2594432 RepID=A0A553BQU3_9FLAO|nr:YigZ family protein [Flavobacterium gawalongense]TRW99794.1 YigZ family protein [Flavobacterium gawalongense]TRX04100.1 YigZ family protein [Flavobacterium gawalongense]TRX10585.1 YigZ family protein [Flavobacterium gawalongense]TRX11734.1 YigZ family protein [Flavobacterium gawalongense]TRX29526.1 YigZ family protein [Flavobacterium gawalongense]
MEFKDTYNTIEFPSSEILFKEKNSKFFGYAYPIQSEDEVKPIIDSLKKQHPNAGHFCYAYQLGTDTITYRANDDGEPSNSAGMPIYGQIQSFSITNVLIVVVRIFGGVKLGVGGLISAYKTTAQMVLETCEIVEKTINIHYSITFDYKNMNKVMRVIKEKRLEIVTQEMEINEDSGLPIGKIELKTRKKNAEMVFDIFNPMFEIDIKRL